MVVMLTCSTEPQDIELDSGGFAVLDTEVIHPIKGFPLPSYQYMVVVAWDTPIRN